MVFLSRWLLSRLRDSLSRVLPDWRVTWASPGIPRQAPPPGTAHGHRARTAVITAAKTRAERLPDFLGLRRRYDRSGELRNVFPGSFLPSVDR